MVTNSLKETIKTELRDSLKSQTEITRIIIFGSFLNAEEPGDVDVAIFQDSDEAYLPLAMKYRKLTRNIAKILPLDIIPLKSGASGDPFLDEIEAGELIYER